MRIHPAPMRRNITLRYDASGRQKQLRRLPHIFAKVLELPFRSDAEVSIEETGDCFRFVVGTDEIGGGGVVRADTVEIYPGVTKIVIRGTDLDFAAGELDPDMWRFRLPALTRPELATAAYDGAELVVTVPKDDDRLDDGGDWREDDGDFAAGRLVLVQ